MYRYNCDVIQVRFFYRSIIFHYILVHIAIASSGESHFDNNFDPGTLDAIKRAGYPAESHFVTTEDGYILEIHRIPGHVDSVPVFLQHELFGSSNLWVFAGRNQSLAYRLSNDGYDVWMGNVRGTTYGKAHRNMSANDLHFWTYSQHELGVYDLPAEISYITNFTSQSVIFIGFSLGSPIGLIMASQRADMQPKIRLMIHLAPAVYIQNIRQILVRIVIPFAKELDAIGDLIGIREFPPAPNLIREIAKFLCTPSEIQMIICRELLMLTFGFDRPQFSLPTVPLLLDSIPDTTSKMVLLHYAQWFDSGRFRQYDYGETINLEIYNSTLPPDYDLQKVKIPNVIFYAEDDWFAHPKDVFQLYDELPLKAGLFKMNYTSFSHLDFRVAIDAPTLLHDRIMNIMKPFT